MRAARSVTRCAAALATGASERGPATAKRLLPSLPRALPKRELSAAKTLRPKNTRPTRPTPEKVEADAEDAEVIVVGDPLAELDAALRELEVKETGISRGAGTQETDAAAQAGCDYNSVDFYEISADDVRKYFPEGLAGAVREEYSILGDRVARHGVISREPATTVLRHMQALQERFEASIATDELSETEEGNSAVDGGDAIAADSESRSGTGGSSSSSGSSSGGSRSSSDNSGSSSCSDGHGSNSGRLHDVSAPNGPDMITGEEPLGEERRAFLLRGERGAGKSCALNQLVHYARTHGWIVLFVPTASRFLHRGKYIRPSKHIRGVFDMPVVAQQMLRHFLDAHDRDLLASVRVKTPEARDRYTDVAVPIVVGTPLPNELTLGMWARTGTLNPDLWEALDRLNPNYDAVAAAAAAVAENEARAKAAAAEEGDDQEEWDDWLKESDEEKAQREAAEAAAAAASAAATAASRGGKKGRDAAAAAAAAAAAEAGGRSGAASAGGKASSRFAGTRTISAEGMTLLDVVEAGLARLDLASAAVWDVRRELGLCTEALTMVAVDEYNSLAQPTAWQWATTRVKAHQLAVVRPFMEFPLPRDGRGDYAGGFGEHMWTLGEAEEAGDAKAVGKLVNGVVVCAVSHTHPERRKPRYEEAVKGEVIGKYTVDAGPYSEEEFKFVVQRMREGQLIGEEANALDELLLRVKTAQVPGRVWTKCSQFTVGDSFIIRGKRAPRRDGLRGNVLNT